MINRDKVQVIYLDEYHMRPFVIRKDTLAQVQTLVLQNQVCQECALLYTTARPMVVLNTCLSCFKQSEVVQRGKNLKFLGLAGLDYSQSYSAYHFMDDDGYIYQVDCGHECTNLTKDTYATLRRWGFTPPETIMYNDKEEKLTHWNWTVYGDFRSSNVVVLHYKENYHPYVDVLFLAYDDGRNVEINKRKKDMQRLFKEAKKQLEATKDEQGVYHLLNGQTAYLIYDSYLYPFIAQIANADYIEARL